MANFSCTPRLPTLWAYALAPFQQLLSHPRGVQDHGCSLHYTNHMASSPSGSAHATLAAARGGAGAGDSAATAGA
uniref:Uncharacterized protein n=1 Tax=Arundo donax TaxID=35708 RepID=A0A0A9ARG8_ARUDO